MTPRDTAGGVVVGPDGRLLLVNQGSGVWSFPKGGIEDGEDSLAAARREIAEETGVSDLEMLADLGSYKRYRIGRGGVGEDRSVPESTRTLFLFRTLQTDLRRTDPGGEVVDVRWVTFAEALALLKHPKDKVFLESVLPKINAILSA